MSQPRASIRFHYWTDPLCIWAFVAQDKLDRLLSAHAGTLVVTYHVVPVFGSIRWRFEEGPWSDAGVEGRVTQTAAIAARFGHPEVSGAGWRAVREGSSWAPGAAVKAVELAQRDGELPTFACERYQRELRSAFFVDDRPVVTRQVQLEVAEACGLEAGPIVARLDDGRALAALWEDHQARERLGIQGSPTYVFDEGRAILYGNVSEGVIVATVEELLGGSAPGRSECS